MNKHVCENAALQHKEIVNIYILSTKLARGLTGNIMEVTFF
jgi:hypothetical protein